MRAQDLLSTPWRSAGPECDVCILGAGAAGLYLATRLAAKGQSVVILEIGGQACGDGASIGTQPIFTGAIYPGATMGRAFGLGGSTSRWGGLLAPHSKHDIRGSSPAFDPWKAIVSTVEARTNAVLSQLGFDHQGDFASLAAQKMGGTRDLLHSRGLETMAAQFLPLASRNLAYLLEGRRPGLENIRIFLHATPRAWLWSAAGGRARVNAVTAAAPNGNEITVRARQVVVAAGAIESARILLEMKRSGGEAVMSKTAEVGCYLSDHLSCRIADVSPRDYGRAAQIFGPRFVRGCLRSFRLVERQAPPDAPRCFAHFIFEIDNPAFRLVKEGLAAWQARRWPKLSLAQIGAGAAGLGSFAWARYGKSALFIPRGTPVRLQLDIEQAPVKSNLVFLGDESDRFGRPIEKIHWRVSDVDIDNIQKAAARILKSWPGSPEGLFDLSPGWADGREPKPHDAYHPVGTCRLGLDDGAVVDPQLRVQGMDNVWVLSTAVLPSAGTANPTFSMLCLGENLADDLGGK